MRLYDVRVICKKKTKYNEDYQWDALTVLLAKPRGRLHSTHKTKLRRRVRELKAYSGHVGIILPVLLYIKNIKQDNTSPNW
jgi:hypothetical protein